MFDLNLFVALIGLAVFFGGVVGYVARSMEGDL
jgi:hypothetical protein